MQKAELGVAINERRGARMHQTSAGSGTPVQYSAAISVQNGNNVMIIKGEQK